MSQTFARLIVCLLVHEHFGISNYLSAIYIFEHSLSPVFLMVSQFMKLVIFIIFLVNFMCGLCIGLNPFRLSKLTTFYYIDVFNWLSLFVKYTFILTWHFTQIVNKSFNRIPIYFFKKRKFP